MGGREGNCGRATIGKREEGATVEEQGTKKRRRGKCGRASVEGPGKGKER